MLVKLAYVYLNVSFSVTFPKYGELASSVKAVFVDLEETKGSERTKTFRNGAAFRDYVETLFHGDWMTWNDYRDALQHLQILEIEVDLQRERLNTVGDLATLVIK